MLIIVNIGRNKWLIHRHYILPPFLVGESWHLRSKQFRLVNIIYIFAGRQEVQKSGAITFNELHVLNMIESNVISNSPGTVVSQQAFDNSMGHIELMLDRSERST